TGRRIQHAPLPPVTTKVPPDGGKLARAKNHQPGRRSAQKTGFRIVAEDIAEGYITRTDDNGRYLGPGTSVQPGDTLAIRISGRKRKLGRLPIVDALGRPVATTRFTMIRPQLIIGQQPWRDGAGFDVTVRWRVPTDLKSGVYFVADYKPLFFVVREPSMTAKVVVLVSTNTFNAYSLTHGRSL